VLRAIVDVLRAWDWAERPVAIVSVPSRRRPQLVSSLAAGIGELGRLPYLGSLDLLEGGPVGDPGGNSAFRLANIWGRLGVGAALRSKLSGIPGPLLLVDDVADSRWTLTVASALLREAGAPAVLPLVLAMEA
jgi:ATP-dependent DNA helicase RecQ